MPERFHFARLDGLRPVVARSADGDRGGLPAAPAGAGARRRASGRPAALRHAGHQPLRARLQRHRDRPAPAAAGGARRPHPAARLRDLPADRGRGRRPRRAGGADPARSSASPRPRAGRRLVGRAPAAPRPARTSGGRAGCAPPTPATTSSSSLSAPRRGAAGRAPPPRRRGRSAPTATCRSSTTSRRSTLESGDPVQAVTLLGALRPPRPALPAVPPGRLGESRADELAWRLVAQLSLNYLGLAVEGERARAAARDARRSTPTAATRRSPATPGRSPAVDARPVVERLPIAGPICFGRGTEVDARGRRGRPRRPQRAAAVGAARAALRALRRRQRLRADPDPAPAWPGGGAMADDARQPQPDLSGGPVRNAEDGLLRAPAAAGARRAALRPRRPARPRAGAARPGAAPGLRHARRRGAAPGSARAPAARSRRRSSGCSGPRGRCRCT